jgi:hypothetical protein
VWATIILRWWRRALRWRLPDRRASAPPPSSLYWDGRARIAPTDRELLDHLMRVADLEPVIPEGLRPDPTPDAAVRR